MNATDFCTSLSTKLAAFDRKGAEQLCTGLVSWLYKNNNSFSQKEAESILQHLRDKRMFLLMQKVGDALIQTGRSSLKIQRFYAHCLVETGAVSAAMALLENLIKDMAAATGNQAIAAKETAEVKGALARACKQVYVQATAQGNATAANSLHKAIQLTLDGYNINSSARLWSGINAVALLCRAQRDGIDITAYNANPLQMAKDMLEEIETMQQDKQAGIWDYATAAEASVALGDYTAALTWLGCYTGSKNGDGSFAADAFEIGSTLRQFKEVWQLENADTPGVQMITLLQAALLQREGGSVTISAQNIAVQKDAAEEPGLEKVFGADAFETYNWYLLGADRCWSVARIGRDISKGFGSGFLLKGADLHSSLGTDFVLLTNAHVLSDDINVIKTLNALPKEDACVMFESLNKGESFGISDIVFSSSPGELDVTIARFKQQDMPRLRALTQRVTPYPVSPVLPPLNNSQRIYIIGHPGGGTLQLSLQDNLLLDYALPRIHYRTPTIGGSSGSPVFNRQWNLIGIHHSSVSNLHDVNGGAYEANEGISIFAIKEALAKALDSKPA